MAKEEVILRSALSDVLKGYTRYRGDSEAFYIKHLKLDDYVDIEDVYERYYQSLIKKGVATEKQLLDGVKKQRLWSDKEEQEIVRLKEYVDNLRETKARSITKHDIEEVSKILKEEELKYYSLISKKNSFIQKSCEHFANQKVENYYILRSLYRDAELQERYISDEDSEDLDFDIKRYVNLYNTTIQKCSSNNIKKIATKSFFRDVYSLAGSVYEFYGKPISSLTYYQINLASYANIFNNIFSKYPNLATLNDEPDVILDKATRMGEIESANAKTKGRGGAHHIGATSEDYASLNMQAPNKNKLFEEAGKKGKVNLING